MQISDEMLRVAVEADSKAFYAGAGKEACMRRALEAALSLPVQPVAWIEERDLQYILRGKGLQAIVFTDEYEQRRPLYTTPPAPPTKGPEDDLIAALEFYANPENWVPGRWASDDEAGDDDVEHLICMGTQDEEMGSVPIADCGDRARAALLALRSRPASALPVVGERPFWQTMDTAPDREMSSLIVLLINEDGDEDVTLAWVGYHKGEKRFYSSLALEHGNYMRLHPIAWTPAPLPAPAALTPSVQP